MYRKEGTRVPSLNTGGLRSTNKTGGRRKMCILGQIGQVELGNAQHLLSPFLKGPKREIFVAGIFAQIRPIRIGDLETRPKNPKKLRLGP